MCLCTLCADRFLRCVIGSESFTEYCRSREISLASEVASPDGWPTILRSWTAAITGMPEGLRLRIDREQAAVTELSSTEGVAHLLEAGVEPCPLGNDGRDWTSIALWFLLHRPTLFWEVYFHHERCEPDEWHCARSQAGLAVSDVSRAASQLTEALSRAIWSHDDTLPLCTVDTHMLPSAVGFSVRIRPAGETACTVPIGGPPAPALCFAYAPADGTVFLQSPLRSVDRVRLLLDCFGEAVLGAPVALGAAGYSLDQLKFPFHPRPDADDMEMVRVKALHLRYPERAGRRLLTLETPASGGPEAIDELLHAHARGEAFEDLEVVYAELQVRLREGHRRKHHRIRLWPDRCDVGRGAVSDRLLSCVRTWGL